MVWSVGQCILATILYSSLFDYPLTEEEIYRWLISPFSQKSSHITKKHLSKLQQKGTYYSNSHIQQKYWYREKTKKWSHDKWNIAKQAVYFLKFIPSVQLIGISGGLAMDSADKDDDIDLFIICKHKTVWTTRLFVLLILTFMGRRRQFGQKKERDFLCPNMFLSEEYMRLPKTYRDIYTAHEALQMEPLFVRGNTYLKFIHQNNWITDILPNAWKWRVGCAQIMKTQKETLISYVLSYFFFFINIACKYIQLVIMKKHKTTEIVTDSVMRFHPNDMRYDLNKKFINLLKQYKVPLDSQFF